MNSLTFKGRRIVEFSLIFDRIRNMKINLQMQGENILYKLADAGWEYFYKLADAGWEYLYKLADAG